MKKNISITMKEAIYIFSTFMIIFVCVISNSFAEEFSLRNGILFGDFASAVKEKEQLKLTDESEDGSSLKFVGTVASYQGEIEYVFDSTNGLTDMCYDFADYENKSTSYESIFASLRDGVTNKYGSSLGFPMGKTHQILGKAFEKSIQMCSFISGFMGKKADILDYEEWFVECDNGAVKIDLVQYYFTNSENRKEYHILLSYHFSSADEISALIQENQEKTDAINNDI